jgi:uncharacterized membrane protein
MNLEFLYGVRLVYIFISLIAIFIGIALWSHRSGIMHAQSDQKSELAGNDFLPTTILGLLALLLGFTFSMSINRFDARNALIVKESNAIGTAFLRSDIFPAEQGNKYKQLLKEYTQLRLSYFNDIRVDTQDYLNKIQDLQNQLWKQTISMVQVDRSPLANSFMQANNDVIDIDAERIFASENHVPDVVFYVMILIASLGLGTLSYSLGLRQKKVLTPIMLSLLFSLVIVLIQDLDRPGRGLIQAHQESMGRVFESIK